jgi:hypothetical protein
MKSLDDFHAYLNTKTKDKEWHELAAALLPHFLEVAPSSGPDRCFARAYSSEHIAGKPDAYRRIVLLFWYCNFTGARDAATYLITLLGTLDVLDSQRERLGGLFGEPLAEKVFDTLRFPDLGSDLNEYPGAINAYLDRMRSLLSEEDCRKVLAGNHHRLDPEQFAPERKYLQEAADLDSYLRDKHARLVQKLQQHADSGELWFEQVITQEVVDYVRDHQEIQTGVREGDRILARKIPYDPSAWLRETDPVKKRFLACHCPFVRAAIPEGEEVSSLWCYCSGGFTKLLFDYLFDTEHEVELLESVLDGGDACRFAIRLKPGTY